MLGGVGLPPLTSRCTVFSPQTHQIYNMGLFQLSIGNINQNLFINLLKLQATTYCRIIAYIMNEDRRL